MHDAAAGRFVETSAFVDVTGAGFYHGSSSANCRNIVALGAGSSIEHWTEPFLGRLDFHEIVTTGPEEFELERR